MHGAAARCGEEGNGEGGQHVGGRGVREILVSLGPRGPASLLGDCYESIRINLRYLPEYLKVSYGVGT